MFWFVEYPGKILENPGKVRENLGKIYENVWVESHQELVRVDRKLFGKFWEIRAKIFRTLKNFPALTPMALAASSAKLRKSDRTNPTKEHNMVLVKFDSIWVGTEDAQVCAKSIFYWKFADRFLVYAHCWEYLREYKYVQVWIIAKRWKGAQSGNSSKACGKPRAFNYVYFDGLLNIRLGQSILSLQKHTLLRYKITHCSAGQTKWLL